MPHHLEMAWETRSANPRFASPDATGPILAGPSTNSTDADRADADHVAGIQFMEERKAEWTAMSLRPTGTVMDHMA